MARGDHVATSVGAGCILKPLADAARVVTVTVTRATGALSKDRQGLAGETSAGRASPEKAWDFGTM